MPEFLNESFLGNPVKNYLWFIGIILLVLIFNRLISKLIGHLLYRLFRRFTAQSMADQFIKLLLKPIELLVIIVSFAFAITFLKYPEVLDVSIYGIHLTSIFKVIYKLILVVAFTWMSLRITDFIMLILAVKAEKTEGKLDDQLIPFVKDFLKVVLVIVAIFIILGVVLDLNINSLLAGVGIGGLAIAFAAQHSLENLLGSFTIFLDRPFTVGDFIQVGDVMGTVEKVGFRSTRIRTADKTYVTLPNKQIVDSQLNNYSLRTLRRVKFFVGLTYDTTAEQIKAIVEDIQKLIDEHPKTNEDGIIGFHEFGASSLDILVQYYAKILSWNDFVELKEELNFKIMEIVKKNGSDFAFPTQTLHLQKEN